MTNPLNVTLSPNVEVKVGKLLHLKGKSEELQRLILHLFKVLVFWPTAEVQDQTNILRVSFKKTQ